MTRATDERTSIRVPHAIGSAAEQVVGAREEPARLTQLLYSSPLPMVIVDDNRRHLHANPPALLAFRAGLAEMRESRIDDRTPPHRRPTLEALWKRLIETGRVTGHYDVANPDGTTLRVVFYALADALPGQHLIAFAPEHWSDGDLAPAGDGQPPQRSDLTRREVELLQLAATGRNGPRIAEELALSPATVKTHFANIYAKLGVRDRSAAVAKAMRLGLVD